MVINELFLLEFYILSAVSPRLKPSPSQFLQNDLRKVKGQGQKREKAPDSLLITSARPTDSAAFITLSQLWWEEQNCVQSVPSHHLISNSFPLQKGSELLHSRDSASSHGCASVIYYRSK